MKSFIYKLSILWWLYGKQLQTSIASKVQSESIISGSPAALGQFPWQVILKENENTKLLCGASIIANKWVLTAAHCLNNKISLFLVFGTIERKNNAINMTCTKFFIHPKFNMLKLINDIGLIELPTALKFTENIQPIELVSSSEASNDFVGAEAIITGFGRTHDTNPKVSDWLLWATLEIVNNSICAKVFGTIDDTEMCTIGVNGTNMSPCEGDSGGALVWKNKMDKWIQIGIFSYLKKNMCSKYPTGHTRVISFLDYIHNITGLKLD